MATKKNTTSNLSWIMLSAFLLCPLVFIKKDINNKRTALINIASDPAEKATITPIFNKMTDDEINICYDVVITKIYGQNVPSHVKNQMKIISEKYNIFK